MTLKKTIVSSLAMFAFGSNVALALPYYAWVQTPFWLVPQVTKVEPTLKSLNPKYIEANCQDFKKEMFNSYGAIRFTGSPAQLDKLRKRDVTNSTGTNFEARYSLSSLVVGMDFSGGWTIDELSEKLPLFSHLKSVTTVYPDKYSELEILADNGPLTKISRRLELTDTEVKIEIIDKAPTLVIRGRDVVCDLEDQMLSIEVQASTLVTLDQKSYSALTRFYVNKIQRELNEVLVNGAKESDAVKAARLGYRMGSHITDRTNKYPEVVKYQIGNMMKLLFASNSLKNSKNVIDIDEGKSKAIKIMDSAEGSPVTLTLKVPKKD